MICKSKNRCNLTMSTQDQTTRIQTPAFEESQAKSPSHVMPPARLDSTGILSKHQGTKWWFPSVGAPPNGWLIREYPIKLDDLGVPPILGKPPNLHRFPGGVNPSQWIPMGQCAWTFSTGPSSRCSKVFCK